MGRWHSANVLEPAGDTRRVWLFSPGNNGDFNLTRELTFPAAEATAPRQVTKDWKSLWQKKLNIAWLPPEKIYLRVLQLPQVDRAETIAMVELQLEKISPLPTPHIVWTLEMLPSAEENSQTVIVVIVPRHLVEEFLGQLEGQGYLADRLEIPVIDQLFAIKPSDNGVWIFPPANPAHPFLLAWWYEGVLRNVSVANLPGGPAQAAQLKSQVEQTAWAGELEGWLKEPPKFHLVANEVQAAEWEAILKDWTEDRVQVIPPLDHAALAASTTRRAANADPKVGLLPGDYSTRYRQQFIDSLWMRGLGAALLLYIFGVIIYLGALQVVKYQHRQVQTELAGLSLAYTNALKTEARVQVLKERQALKYAALDCWRAVAETLPPEVKVESLIFRGGKAFEISGTVAPDQQAQVANFNDALRQYTIDGKALFTRVNTPNFNTRGTASTWRFNAELRSADSQ